MEEKEILKQYSSIIDQLLKHKIIRSRNNPVSDYAEKVVADKLGFKLENPSNRGYDAVDKNGIKYQIKGRQLFHKGDSKQLGIIRNLNKRYFDYLIGIVFDKYFYVKEAWKIPHNIIEKYSKFNKHQNGHILILKGEVLKDKKVSRIKKLEERKLNKSKKTAINTFIKQGMVKPCAGKKGLFATFGIWTKKQGKRIYIHIAGDKNFKITVVTDDSNLARGHKHLFDRLKRLLIAYDKWPY